jgi:hypothetical protein
MRILKYTRVCKFLVGYFTTGSVCCLYSVGVCMYAYIHIYVCVCVIEENSWTKWYREWRYSLFPVLTSQKYTSKEIWNVLNVPEHKTDRRGRQSNFIPPDFRTATFHRCLPSWYWISFLGRRLFSLITQIILGWIVLHYFREYLTKFKLSYIKHPLLEVYFVASGVGLSPLYCGHF